MTWNNFEQYANQQHTWLEMEGEAERERMVARRRLERRGDAERSGETIVNLQMADYRTGLAGRLLLDLVKANGERIPLNRLKVGSPIVLSDNADASDQGMSGVVSRRKAHTIQVALDNWPEAERFRLDLSPDETTRRRQQAAMRSAKSLTGSQARLRDTLLGFQAPRFDRLPEINFFSQLNEPQREAIKFALSARDVAILHGPPGTGKTTTLAELIYQTVQQGGRVLACAPSNTAVDNMLEKLVDMLPHVLRVGHPARVFESLRNHTLDEIVEADPASKIVRDLWRDVDELMRAASKQSRSREANRQRGELYSEAGRLRKEARALERNTVRHILESADVICTTTTIDDDLLGKQEFALAVIDEACQCTEPAIWQAMLRAPKLVLAGDHCQLPPTVVSKQAAAEGFSSSAMERLIDRFDQDVFRRLKVQYRMNEHIMRFSSDQFYDGDLEAHESVRSHSLADFAEENRESSAGPVDGASRLNQVLQFWDTAGAEWEEELEPNGLSKRNPKEATWVLSQVHQLLKTGIRPDQIAIIAPYAAQVRLLRDRLQQPDLEIDTVDGFQGREKEVVLLTLVRSNSESEIGFLKDTRRTNVALTRAKRALRVIGDSATLAGHSFYKSMIDYFEQQSAYHTVWELSEGWDLPTK